MREESLANVLNDQRATITETDALILRRCLKKGRRLIAYAKLVMFSQQRQSAILERFRSKLLKMRERIRANSTDDVKQIQEMLAAHDKSGHKRVLKCMYKGTPAYVTHDKIYKFDGHFYKAENDDIAFDEDPELQVLSLEDANKLITNMTVSDQFAWLARANLLEADELTHFFVGNKPIFVKRGENSVLAEEVIARYQAKPLGQRNDLKALQNAFAQDGVIRDKAELVQFTQYLFNGESAIYLNMVDKKLYIISHAGAPMPLDQFDGELKGLKLVTPIGNRVEIQGVLQQYEYSDAIKFGGGKRIAVGRLSQEESVLQISFRKIKATDAHGQSVG